MHHERKSQYKTITLFERERGERNKQLFSLTFEDTLNLLISETVDKCTWLLLTTKWQIKKDEKISRIYFLVKTYCLNVSEAEALRTLKVFG